MESDITFPPNVHPVNIGGKRFAVVKTFNKAVYVNLREYYTDPLTGSRALAGRRGINLTLENWEKLYSRMKEIDRAVVEMKRKAEGTDC